MRAWGVAVVDLQPHFAGHQDRGTMHAAPDHPEQ